MRLYILSALAGLGCLVSGNAIDLDKRATQCAITGGRIIPAYFATQQSTFTDPAQCGALCKSQLRCQSYAVEDETCRLYLSPVLSVLTKIFPGNNTFYDRACATNTNLCEVNGFRSLLNQPFVTDTKFPDNNFKTCGALCKSTAGCASFSIEIATGGACRLYKNALYKDFIADSTQTQLYFDIGCPSTVANAGPPLASYVPSTTVPSITTEAAVTFASASTPGTLTTNDPPYTPTGPQATPTDDDEFISTYTYDQYALPTVVSMGAPPNTVGLGQPTTIPTAPCMLQPGPQAPFSLLNENFVPMVSRVVSSTTSIGPLLQPTVAPAANDPILNPETFVTPSFYLQAVSGVSGVYDMVYAGSSPVQYVALTNTGAVVLVGTSTGTSFVNNRVTTIFGVDCFGVLSITQGGSDYTWSTTGSKSTMVKAATPAKNMKALPVNLPAVQSARKNRKRNQELAERLAKRSYSDGPAPKCPAQPPALVARTKQGYQLDTGNFCDNLSDNWGYSPFDFTGSCAVQSLCYDQCEDFGWQSCNGIFGTMMILSCLSEFEHWWEVVEAIACAAQASYFTGVAATSTGRGLFYKAQGNMCKCFCSSPPDTCVFTDGSFYCADIHGSDDANCGNCGRQCGPHSKCRSGNCGCPLNQCGTTCLDFRNNPNNCGSCGNVCNPSYCISGQCYVPVPGSCTPDQSVYNNDFTSYYPSFTNWTMAAYPGCSLGSNINFSPTNYFGTSSSTGDPALLVEMTSLPSGGCGAALVQAEVKMCPGFQYELTFAMGYVGQISDSNVLSNADCTVRWVTGTPDSVGTNDAFQASPSYSIGISNQNYKTFGPWSLHVAQGDPGVYYHRKSLYVNLTAVIQCSGPTNGAGRFIIRDVEMNPVSQFKRDESAGVEGGLWERDGTGNGSTTTNITSQLVAYEPVPKVLVTSLVGGGKNVTKRDAGGLSLD